MRQEAPMHFLSGSQIRDGFLGGKFRAQDVLQHFFQRIAQHDPKIGAFLHVFHTRARLQAELLDQRRAKGGFLGKLAGIPVAVKDNIHVIGEVTTCGSKFLSHYRAPFQATVARLLEEEGAILIGKTNLDEFAIGSSTETSAFQKTFNPWNRNYSPGGSSGGSSAAVAARLCPIALGSDTGGSIRQPAAFCGVVGFKPTYGKVSRFGLVSVSSSMDQIGPLANTVEDVEMVMDVIGRHCGHDAMSLPENTCALDEKGLEKAKIGVPWNSLACLDKEARLAFENALAKLSNKGMEIVEVNLDSLEYSLAAYLIIAMAEAAINLARFDGIKYGEGAQFANSLEGIYEYARQAGFGMEVKRRIMLGTYMITGRNLETYYQKASKVRALIAMQYREALRSCDAIALPTTSGTAFKMGDKTDMLSMSSSDAYTIPANLVGLPALSIPCGFSSQGLPYGFQLIGSLLQDKTVLQIGRILQNELSCYKMPEEVKDCHEL